ncbi:restriction endonuclease subunit S [Pseudoalteromonas sp. G4]|uniref:restriction endonuclease subunit S n=1 Tax=Pseudoalteromonas sp. G4 TaxID=2992761 RepID=UPI00237E61EA|nr:restriction endonuclease subunit S [Pseudoalteromonas sp. G4]MDE3271377.1 restriction endonuclease subunit S [Pseudoalteromonas sp. G4]
MNELPKGWFITPLDELAIWGAGGTPKRSEPSYYGGEIPWVKTGDLGPKYLKSSNEFITELGVSNSSAKLFKKGSVAIAMYGATIGKTSILDFDATTNQACAVGQPIGDVTTTEFLYYLLNSEKNGFIKKGKGGAQPNISQQIIKSYQVSLPPLNEQKRIVEKLDDVLAQVDAIKGRLDSIPNIIKRFRQSVLASAVSGKLTEEWRKLNLMSLLSINELEELNTAQRKKQIIGRLQKAKLLEGLPSIELPKFWNWCSIDLCALKITDGTHHSPESHAEGDYMYVTSKNVREGYIDLSKITYVSKDTHDEIFSRCDVAYGDVLYVKDGANTGLACVNNINEQISLLSSVGVIKVANYLLPKYLQHYLNSPIGRKLMLDKMGGTAIKRLTLKKIKESPLSLPPIEEQTEIVRLVDEYFALADTIEAQVNKARARVDSLTQSILAKAFRGELVPQDDSDEPADKLLERIAQAKAEAEALAKAAKKAETAKKRAAKKASA